MHVSTPGADIGPSGRLSAFILVTHLLSLALVHSLIVPVPVLVLLDLTIAASGLFALRRHGLRLAADSITRFQMQTDHRCLLHYRDGRIVPGTLTADSVVTGPVTILVIRLDQGWRWRTLVLLTDNTDAQAYRRLRVSLRFS